jgi:superfamily I DNA and/or RNA helicase
VGAKLVLAVFVREAAFAEPALTIIPANVVAVPRILKSVVVMGDNLLKN